MTYVGKETCALDGMRTAHDGRFGDGLMLYQGTLNLGSAKAVSRAGVEDLMVVDGVSEAMAQRIYDHFQKG